MSVTPEHRQTEGNAQPVYLVNGVGGVGWMIVAVTVGVTLGILAAWFILTVLNTTL